MTLISLHQPEFLPWIGLFHKISIVDEFVFLDHVQYVKQSFHNRNSILQLGKGRELLTLPVNKSSHTTPINKVEICKDDIKINRVLRKIWHNYRHCDYFNETFQTLSNCFEKGYCKLADLNISLISQISRNLGLAYEFRRTSDIKVNDLFKLHKTDLLYFLCRYYKADSFLCGSGAKKAYFDKSIFSDVKVKYHNFDQRQLFFPSNDN